MVNQMQDGVPILGQPKPTHALAPGIAFVRELDENGLVVLTDGALKREQILDVNELLAEFRRIVREEVRLARVSPDA